jgi:hypothetical protein
MLKNKLLFIVACIGVILIACKSSIKQGDLYGKWKYVKIENLDIRTTTIVTPEQLESEIPYIQFSKNDSALIWWGGKVLTHGSYRVEGNQIMFKEILADGKTREFPFIVSKLDYKNIVFETSGDDAARVTAVKQDK